MSWIERAYVGQKVVCIKVIQAGGVGGETYPIEGQVYTIRKITSIQDVVGFQLVEIVNSPRRYANGRKECYFRASHFKPVKSTDAQVASIIRAALNIPEHV